MPNLFDPLIKSAKILIIKSAKKWWFWQILNARLIFHPFDTFPRALSITCISWTSEMSATMASVKNLPSCSLSLSCFSPISRFFLFLSDISSQSLQLVAQCHVVDVDGLHGQWRNRKKAHILPLSLISLLFFFINFYVSLHVKAYMHAHGKRRRKRSLKKSLP